MPKALDMFIKMTNLISTSAGVQTRRMAAARENQQPRAERGNEALAPVEAGRPNNIVNQEAPLAIAQPGLPVHEIQAAQNEGPRQLEAEQDQAQGELEIFHQIEQPTNHAARLQPGDTPPPPEDIHDITAEEDHEGLDRTPTNEDNPIPGPSQVTFSEHRPGEDSPGSRSSQGEQVDPSSIHLDELWQSDSESSRFFETGSESGDSPKDPPDQRPQKETYGGYPHKPFPHGRYPHQGRKLSSPSETTPNTIPSRKRPGQKRAGRPGTPTDESPPRNASAPDQSTGPQATGGEALEPSIHTFRALRHLASHNNPGLKENEGGRKGDPGREPP
jgi:hypothetical protein